MRGSGAPTGAVTSFRGWEFILAMEGLCEAGMEPRVPGIERQGPLMMLQRVVDTPGFP